VQLDGHYTSKHLEPSLNDVSGESDFDVFPRKLNQPTACLSVEIPAQLIQQKLSFDEELQLKGRDLIRRIREKRKELIVSDFKGRVVDPSDDPMDHFQRLRDSLNSSRKSELTLSSPESQSNERSRVVGPSDGLIDLVQRPKHSLSSPRKSELTLLSLEEKSSERSRSNFSGLNTDNYHENELVSFLTGQNRAPRSPPTMSPRRTKLKKRTIVFDMAALETLHTSVDDRYEDRQEEYQQSKHTSSAAPEMIFNEDRTRYNDGDKLKRSRPDAHHDFESSIPCPLKSPTKKFDVNKSSVDASSPPPTPRGKDKSFLASELFSGYPCLSPASPESPIGELSVSMFEEASELNYELGENSIISTESSNSRKERRGKVASPYSQSPESSHRIKAKPVINVSDDFDFIILRRRADKSDLKQGQKLSPTSVFDCFETAKDPVLQTSSDSLVLRDPISSGNLAFVDDQEGDPLFLDDDEDFWASNSIVGSDSSLPTHSFVESEYCPPDKAYRVYHGMLNPTRFEI
jgi:hypothetical protein